jgi:hypothetical protein
MVRSVRTWAAAAALTVLVSASAWANANGKWTWKQMARDNEITMTLELKQEGEKITGTVMREGRDEKTEIKEGTIKGADISFVVVRMRQDGGEFRTVYKGKLEGNVIKGNYITNFGGEERSREWKADRAAQ